LPGAACCLPLLTRSHSARLVAQELGAEEGESSAGAGLWAHSLPAAEPGAILLANPALFSDSQQYFQRAAIFLFSHSAEGSSGLILNRRTEHTLGGIAGAAPFLPTFASSPLYLGGDVGRSSLHVLHADNPTALPSSTTVVPGVAMGGFADAVKAVESGQMAASDFRFFTRYAGWGPGQLEEEVRSGVWFVAAAAAGVVLNEPPDAALRPGEEARKGGGPHGLWAKILRLMGGEFAALAEAESGSRESD